MISSLLSIYFFWIPEILRKTEGFLYKAFRFGTVRQKLRRKIVIPPPPPPFLCIKFFATRNFLKHSTEGFPYEIFRHCETKNIRRKILILPPPPLIRKHFRYRTFSETQIRRVRLRNFSAL